LWIKEGPGVRQTVAELMLEGDLRDHIHASDIARVHEQQKSAAHVRARASEGFNKM